HPADLITHHAARRENPEDAFHRPGNVVRDESGALTPKPRAHGLNSGPQPGHDVLALLVQQIRHIADAAHDPAGNPGHPFDHLADAVRRAVPEILEAILRGFPQLGGQRGQAGYDPAWNPGDPFDDAADARRGGI